MVIKKINYHNRREFQKIDNIYTLELSSKILKLCTLENCAKQKSWNQKIQ